MTEWPIVLWVALGVGGFALSIFTGIALYKD
jgi:hypothetical protein